MVVDGHQHEPRLVVELASCCLLSPPPWGLLDERPVLRRHCFCYAVDLGDAKCGGSLQGPIAAYPYPFALPIYELLLLLLKTRTRTPAGHIRTDLPLPGTRSSSGARGTFQHAIRFKKDVEKG